MLPEEALARVPAPVLALLARLEGAGRPAYLVGGGVRDILRGQPPHDWDIASAALPDEATLLFSDAQAVIPTGAAHGTITVVVNGPEGPLAVEHTTLRTEGPYTDGRRPDTVTYTHDILADLARRDFTVNALALRPGQGLLDPFGGAADLAAGVLRCVGTPAARFEEDGLRVLRAVRFCACLGLAAEEDTRAAIHSEKGRLAVVSAERIWAEFVKTVCGPFAPDALREYGDVLAVFLPELAPLFGFAQNSPYHPYDVWEHTLRSLALVPPVPVLRLAMLFHDCGKPACYTEKDGRGHFYGHPEVGADLTRKALARLRADGETARTVEALVRYHDRPVNGEERVVKRLLATLGPDLLDMLFQVKRADVATHTPALSAGRAADIEEAQAVARRLLARQSCFSLSALAVKGDDLLALGLTGPGVGAALNAMLNAVIDGACPNEKQELLDFWQRENGG